jgi:ATP-dependent Clp protease ATP-binding subunit ClpC
MPSALYFDPSSTKIANFLLLRNKFFFNFASLLRKIFIILCLIFFLIFFFGYFLGHFPKFINDRMFGFSVLSFALFLFFSILESFFNYLKEPSFNFPLKSVLEGKEKENLADFMEMDLISAFLSAQKFSKKNKIDIDFPVLNYFLISHSFFLDFVLQRCLLLKENVLEKYKNYFSSKKEGESFGFSKEVLKSIVEAAILANSKRENVIKAHHLFSILFKKDPVFKEILIENKLKEEDIEVVIEWREEIEKKIEERKIWWELNNLRKFGSLGKEWSAGYTITLDRYSIDLSKEVMRLGYPEIIGHKKEIEMAERILSKQEASNDPLIVGEAGSGRRSIVLALAKKCLLGESLPQINYKKFVQLNLQALLSQVENFELVESILDRICQEVVRAGNIILVIDELHNFVGSKTLRPGTIDISGILTPYISSPYFQIIGITTFEGLHKNIEQNPSFLSYFEKVEVSEVSRKETLLLLERFALSLERKFKIYITYPALRDIVNYCEKYLPAIPFPEKALDLLEEVLVHLAQAKEKILLPKHVAKIVSSKTKIPVGELEEKEKELLLNLENILHERVINQEEAIKEVSSALRRARAEITVRKGPIGSFLFLGPTGVGKTETAKALAEFYFGSENNMIRIDMSEFQNASDIPRLIGSPEEVGLLTTPVRERPFSLVLLDEFEKANSNILNLFLQVFDEGHLTDGLGRKVDFKNTIIIATSNAGYQLIFKASQEKRDWNEVKKELINYLVENSIFRPELLNRFDAVILFHPLSKENLLSIAELLLKKIKDQLKKKDVDLVVEKEVLEQIVALSYTPEFGARQMQRVIQDKVANVLAQYILEGKIKRGERILINKNFEILKL